MTITRTEYLTCPPVNPCDQSEPEMRLNSDLLRAYLLVKNERDTCAVQTQMIVDCQKRQARAAQAVNVEN